MPLTIEQVINNLKHKEQAKAAEAYDCEQKARLLRAEELTFREAADMVNKAIAPKPPQVPDALMPHPKDRF